jgi:hypothetical protein
MKQKQRFNMIPKPHQEFYYQMIFGSEAVKASERDVGVAT